MQSSSSATTTMLEDIRGCTVLAQDAIAYSARPHFARVMTSHGGFFVRVALGNLSSSDNNNNNNSKMAYRAARVIRVDELAEPYRARGLLTDAELVVDVLPGAKIRLTHISNSPITAEEFDMYCTETGMENPEYIELQKQIILNQQQRFASTNNTTTNTAASDFSSSLLDPISSMTTDSLLPPPPPTSASENHQQNESASMIMTQVPANVPAFLPNPLHEPHKLAQLAAILRACWLNDLVNRVLKEDEQNIVIERNEKLQRARRNLAGTVNSLSSKIELLLQQQQKSEASSQQQRQQRIQTQQNNNDNNNTNNNEMMGGTQALSATQLEAMLIANDDQQPSSSQQQQSGLLAHLPPALLDQLISANDRFSNYLEHSSCSNANLVRLTERARKRNEMIGLRGEYLRHRRDQDLISQGLATVFNDNVWTLDRNERGGLANAFIHNHPRDTSGDPKIEIVSADGDKDSKPARIAYEAIRQAAGYYMHSCLAKNNEDERQTVVDVANSSTLPANMNSRHKNLDADAAIDASKVKQVGAAATSILSKFGGQDIMNRLLRDAAAVNSPNNSGNNASPGMFSQSSNSNSSSNNGGGGSSVASKNSSVTTNVNNLFSLPRRRDREERQQPISNNNNNIVGMNSNSNSMMLMTVPNNSSMSM